MPSLATLKPLAGDLPGFKKLLSPSWLSGLLAVVVGLSLSVGVVATYQYRGSTLELLRNDPGASGSIQYNSDTINNRFKANQIVSDLPLLILWGAVGLLVYSLAAKIIGAFRDAVDLEQELHYVHADRQLLIRQAFLRFALRLLALIVWLLYIRFTIHVLIPYVIAVAYAGAGAGISVEAGLYLLEATVLATLAVHLHVILLRLLLLRPRAFGQTV